MKVEGLNLLEWFVAMERTPDEWNFVNEDFDIRRNVNQLARLLVHDAYVNKNQDALATLHECLAIIYRNEFECTRIEQVNADRRPIVSDVQSVLEGAMLQYEMQGLSDADVSGFPGNGKEYVKWLKKLVSKSPSSVHPFYTHFLSEEATATDVKYYLIQETNLDPKFDDILAFMQIGLPVGQKLELAKNYFDEMGNGVEADVHSRMFAQTLRAAGVDDSDMSSAMLLQSIVSGNVSSCLALSRRHYFKAVGYFGVTEYLAPRRFKHVIKAWERNNMPAHGIEYHKLHVYIDTEHANGWFNNVVVPLVDQDPRIGREIAIGALIRINSSARYLDELSVRLGSNATTPA